MRRKIVKNCSKRVSQNPPLGGYRIWNTVTGRWYDNTTYRTKGEAEIAVKKYLKSKYAINFSTGRKLVRRQLRIVAILKKDIKNPHGFCIVDQHLNKIASGNDYDKLQDRVDKHNEEYDEKWFVIDESDYMELNKKGRRNPRLVDNGGRNVVRAFIHGESKKVANDRSTGDALFLYGNKIAERRSDGIWITDAGWATKTTKDRLNQLPSVRIHTKAGQMYLNGKAWDGQWVNLDAWGESVQNPLPLTQYPVSRSNRITKDDFTRINNDVNGNPRYVIHFLRIAPSYERALKIAKKAGGRKFHNKQYGGGIAFQSYSLDELINHLEPLTERRNGNPVQNVSMGYYDSSGFHPIRASHDYDEDAVDEHYRKRPVRKYARKEKAFKSRRRNPSPKVGQYYVFLEDRSNPRYFGTRSEALAFIKKEGKHYPNVVLQKTYVVTPKGGGRDELDFRWEYFAYGKKVRSSHKRNTATASNPEMFNVDKLDKLSGIFQGHINGKQVRTVGSDWTPPLTARLGKLAYMKLKNGKETYEINFDANGDAWLSADARKNIYLEGKDARIANAAKPKRGSLIWLGEVQQINYRTNKSHIENGQLVEYYHELGEVDGVKPNAFLDHDGFILLNGGNYDIDVHGIEN